jgi:hypothetical protein
MYLFQNWVNRWKLQRLKYNQKSQVYWKWWLLFNLYRPTCSIKEILLLRCYIGGGPGGDCDGPDQESNPDCSWVWNPAELHTMKQSDKYQVTQWFTNPMFIFGDAREDDNTLCMYFLVFNLYYISWRPCHKIIQCIIDICHICY